MRLDPQFVRYMVFAGSLAVLAAGLAREAFVLNVGTGTIVQDLRQFNLDAENSVPAWWSSSLMLGAAGLLYVLGAQAWHRNDVLWRMWSALAAVFLLMSIDEAASFHEGFIMPLRDLFGFGGLLFYAWVVPAILCLAALGLFLLPLLKRLPVRLFWQFALAGGLFVLGALGMEMIGGWLDYEGYRPTALYALSISIEEGLEILGLSLFVATLLDQFDPSRALVGIHARQVRAEPRMTRPPLTGAGQFPAAGAE